MKQPDVIPFRYCSVLELSRSGSCAFHLTNGAGFFVWKFCFSDLKMIRFLVVKCLYTPEDDEILLPDGQGTRSMTA